MPITVPTVTAQHTAYIGSLRAIVDACESVDSYCVDYLDSEGRVDRDYLSAERVDHVMHTLGELDAIVVASDTLAKVNGIVADPHLFAVTVKRASSLATAIRESLASMSGAL